MDFLDREGFMMPYKIGPKETCQIGGNMSTNCGGMHVVRYGTRHSAILGLEVVRCQSFILVFFWFLSMELCIRLSQVSCLYDDYIICPQSKDYTHIVAHIIFIFQL